MAVALAGTRGQDKSRALAPGVVITGMGTLSCIGLGREGFWEGLRKGRSGIGPVERFDVSGLPCQIAGEMRDFHPEDFIKKKLVKHWHRHVHQGVASSRLAVEDAGLAAAGYDPERMAVSIGTSVGSPDEAYKGYVDAYESGGYRRVSKFASSAFAGHAATVHVSVDIGLRGPAITIASGCATGLDVLSWGYNQIRWGNADAAVVGATESPLFLSSFVTACSLGILSRRNNEPSKAMRPFDKGRDGIVLSEGACALVLEREDYARARGARILAEVAGNGSAAEGLSPLILDREGKALSRALRMAMKEAGVGAADIDCIEAHGVSLEMYDQCETNAYKNVLGRHAYRVPVTAIKSMIGQPYAAGGLLGVGAALLALKEGIISPTLNLEDPDPACDLDYVPGKARRNDVSTAMVVSISFGGTHSATVLRRVA